MNICKKLFGKNKKNYIRFFCMHPGVRDLFPIAPISSLRRRWLEDNPVQEKDKNIKATWVQTCPGIKKLINTGFVISTPVDFEIETKDKGNSVSWKSSFVLAGQKNFISFLDKEKADLVIDDKGSTLRAIIKVNLPWKFELSDDLIMLMLPVTYNNEPRFYAASGILDGRYTNDLNIQLFWKVLDGKVTIEAGTPLVHLIPIKRDSLILSNYNIVIDDINQEDMIFLAKKEFAHECKFQSYNNFSKKLSFVAKIFSKRN